MIEKRGIEVNKFIKNNMAIPFIIGYIETEQSKFEPDCEVHKAFQIVIDVILKRRKYK